MKWMYLLYWLFLWCSGEFWDKSLAEKLTQEQVLEELGVKIETKEWTYSVTAVEGQLVELPCNASTSKPGDEVKLVLWFKNGSNKPIYTYDNRDGSHSHWSDDSVLKGRGLFLSKYSPARLTIENVNYADQSMYKCRVDFKMAPTSISSITLQVIVPPAIPMIFVKKKSPNDNLLGSSSAGLGNLHGDKVNTNSSLNDVIYTVSHEDWKQDYIMVTSPFQDQSSSKGNSFPPTEIGPYTVGDILSLRCLSTRGQPLPNVTWWRDNSVLLDETFENHTWTNKKEVVLNDLEIPNLQRNHNQVVLTCKSANTLMSSPTFASVKILMRYGPSVVKLRLQGKTLSAGKSHQIKCEAIGAKPQATITWWVGGKQINNFVSSALMGHGNATVSTLTYSPKPEDHGRLLACQAHVEGLPGSIVEDSRRLWVQYAPRVELQLGRSLNASSIKEGDDVYFECLIYSNPPPKKIVWTRQGEELHYSLEDGIIISNQSLVLQKVTRKEGGFYQCHATNQEGQGSSQTVKLPIKYKPYCRPDQQDVYGVATGETVRIPCDVFGDPKETMKFEWVFNTSTEWYPKQPDSALGVTSAERGWTRAYIQHTPKSEMDFGSILCWATNDIGRQIQPCVFHLLPAGKPDPVSNCTVASSSYSTMRIYCEPGFNGGLKQTFTLEIRETESSLTSSTTNNNNNKRSKSGNNNLENLDGRTRPDFMLTGLIPDTGYTISVFAVNPKGQSDRMVLQAYTQKSDQLFETNESALTNMDGFQLTPVMGVLLIVGSSIALVFLTISAYFCVRKRLVSRGGGSSTGNRNSGGGGAEIRTYSVGYNVESSNVVVSEANEFETSMNPDVIPRSKDEPFEESIMMVESCPSPRIRPKDPNDTSGGFEVQGDKTKFATLQRQRKQLYDELRDTKCRAQSLRGAHLSPSQFEGSSEKLLIKDSFDMSPKLYSDGNRGAFYGGGGTFSSSSGRPSPCSTPTPPPYSRNRTMSPIKTLPSQWSAITTNPPSAPSSSMITRVKQGNKFMTYSCPEAEMIAEEDNFEDTSVASSRESRV